MVVKTDGVRDDQDDLAAVAEDDGRNQSSDGVDSDVVAEDSYWLTLLGLMKRMLELMKMILVEHWDDWVNCTLEELH